MVSGINSISATSVSMLFGTAGAATTNSTSGALKLLKDVSGNSDDVMKTGDTIGTIIALASQQEKEATLFQMQDAQRQYAANGDYSETATGQGTVVSDSDMVESALANMQSEAAGTGPQAERARAYLRAFNEGSIQSSDLSEKAVTSTYTKTRQYYSDGTAKGEMGSYNTRGLDAFLSANTTVDDTGILRDKATGKYAGIEQNGTQFKYIVY